jgi:hypothetical protein
LKTGTLGDLGMRESGRRGRLGWFHARRRNDCLGATGVIACAHEPPLTIDYPEGLPDELNLSRQRKDARKDARHDTRDDLIPALPIPTHLLN